MNQPTDMDLSSEGTEDDGVWKVTPHGEFLAKALAEFDLVHGADVLELGAGVANHTILLARKGAKSVVATEIHETFLESTRANFERNCPDYSTIEYRVADWLNVEGTFDVVVTNPPFAKSGKQNRRYYIDSLILDGHKRLRPRGRLIFVQSSMADLQETQRLLDKNGYDHEVLISQQGPFRDYYFEDQTFMDEIQKVPNGFEVKDGQHYETLFVVHATLRDWSPPDGAHLPPPQ